MPEGPKVAIWKKKDGVGFETPGGWRVRVGGNMRQNGKDITSVTQYSLQSSPHIQTSVTCGLLVSGQGVWVYVRMCGGTHGV